MEVDPFAGFRLTPFHGKLAFVATFPQTLLSMEWRGDFGGYLPPVVEMPWMKVFWAKKKSRMMGRVKRVLAAMSCIQLT